MAKSTANYAPITERQQESAGNDFDDQASSGGCGCFRRLCFGGEGRNYLLREETWVQAEFKKVKEFTETIAGPKWKNSIRKMGKFFNPKKYKKQTPQEFQYSPQSYALNFAGDDADEEDGTLLHSFSRRFAAGAVINDLNQARPLL